MTAACAGRGGVLLITGPAGIGKTVLLEAARERAAQAEMRVLAGRGGSWRRLFVRSMIARCLSALVGTSAAEREALLAGLRRSGL